jgi:hypothetical protein
MYSMKQWLPRVEVLVIVLLAFFPLLGDVFPYRLNIFLSYEGAYRLYLGQVPYKDFGIPLGFTYWVVPALFFKIFGPYMMSLVKAQVFLNIVSGLSFRAILKNLSIRPGIRFSSVILFCISYSFLNYWPWYNHTVIVYELLAIALLTKYLFDEDGKWRYLFLVLSAFFVFISFYTKQDAGAMTFLICMSLLVYNSVILKKWKPLIIFLLTLIITGLLFFLPFQRYNIGYWFNHGQLPHTARISIADIASDFFNESYWLKFYIFIILLLLAIQFKNWRSFYSDHHKMILTLLVAGILIEAAIFQVTSYVPADNNIFFHSFAVAFILTLIAELVPVNFESVKILTVSCIGIMLWWSNVYWRFIDRYIIKPSPQVASANVVNKKTYLILKPDSSDIPLSEWRTIPLKSFNKILLPGPTVDGINRLMQMDIVKKNMGKGNQLKVLNMTELTPLARELNFELERGSYYPLWYHKGVSMFQKETDMFCDRIQKNYYDLALFEYIPYLNNFYPFEVRDYLQRYYKKVDNFTAPRKPSLQAWVEVYVRKDQPVSQR